jgi:hypothetical protein
MLDRVVEAIIILGGTFGIGVILGVEIGRYRERLRWSQFRNGPR